MNFNINMEISNNCWGGWNIRNCDKLLGEMASQMEKGIRVEKIGLDGYKEKRIIKEYSNDKYCFYFHVNPVHAWNIQFSQTGPHPTNLIIRSLMANNNNNKNNTKQINK